MSTARTFLLAAVVAFAAACSDEPSGPRMPAAGKFRLNLAGDYAARHTGDAVFGVDGAEGEEFFAVLLGTEEEDLANLAIFRGGTTRLATGVHQVANTSDDLPDDPADVEIYLGVGNAGSSTVGFFDGKSGTVTVTQSTPDVLAGTFAIVAKGLLEENGGTAHPATVQVSGAFTARSVPGQSAQLRLAHVRMQRLAR